MIRFPGVQAAIGPRPSAGFPEAERPANRWSPARRRIVEQAHGQWLSLLDRYGALDPSCTQGERATADRLSQFGAELRARVAR